MSNQYNHSAKLSHTHSVPHPLNNQFNSAYAKMQKKMLQAMGAANGYGLGALRNDEDEPEEIDYKASMGDSVSIASAKDIVESILETDIVPFLWGPPGVGKSSIIKQICEEKGWRMIDFRLSTINPVDLMGMPTVDQAAGVAKWLPPEYLPKTDSKEVGVLFLDELNLAPLAVQAAAYQLILDKRVGAYVFPKTWKMVSAGNRETDQANVYKISAPLANRFMHISVAPDLDAWVKWAQGKVDETVISFLIVRHPLLFQMPKGSERAFPTPRSWVYVSDFIKAFKYVPGTRTSPSFEKAVTGAVGSAVGQEFLTYVADFDLMDVNRIVQRFIDTGDVELPRGDKGAQLSTRFAITTAITKAYKSRKITRERFETFLNKLSDEERATVRTVLADAGKVMSGNKNYTFLDTDLDDNSTSMFVNDTSVFKETAGVAEIVSPDGGTREVVNYSILKGSKGVQLLERGISGTHPRRFLSGSFVKPL